MQSNKNLFFKKIDIENDVKKFYKSHEAFNNKIASFDIENCEETCKETVCVPFGYYSVGFCFDKFDTVDVSRQSTVWLNAFPSHYTSCCDEKNIMKNTKPYQNFTKEQLIAIIKTAQINTNSGIKDMLWMLNWNKRKNQYVFSTEDILEKIRNFKILKVKNVESRHIVLVVNCDDRNFDVFACNEPLPQIASDSILFLKNNTDLNIICLKRNVIKFTIDELTCNAVGAVGYVGGAGEHIEFSEIIELVNEHNRIITNTNTIPNSNDLFSFCEIVCPQVLQTIKRGDGEEIGFTTKQKFLAGVDDREFRDKRYTCFKFTDTINDTTKTYLVGPNRYSASFIVVSVGELNDVFLGKHTDKIEIAEQTVVNAELFLREFTENGNYPPGFSAHKQILKYAYQTVLNKL